MKKSAKILCSFGLIEMALSFMAAFVFAHTPIPWALSRGSEISLKALEKDSIWQGEAVLWSLFMSVVGLIFLIGGFIMYLRSLVVSSN